jgi:uroporphyrinogen-III synthase
MGVEQHATDLPLKGLRVLITRQRAQARELCVALEGHGASAVVVPALEFGPPLDPKPLDDALLRIRECQWVAFTSANGVDFTLRRLAEVNKAVQGLTGVKVAVIGSATVEALERHNIQADLVPSKFTNEAFVQALLERLKPGERVLLPRAELADETIPDLLKAAGVSLDVVIAYRSFPPKNLAVHAREAFRGGIDAVTFTSPSTIDNLVAALGEERGVLEKVIVACIGPATARAARAAGLTVHAEAAEQTAKGLVEALVDWRLKGAAKA